MPQLNPTDVREHGQVVERTTVAELLHELEGRPGYQPIRIEDADGNLLGDIVTDVYRYAHHDPDLPGKYVVCIAVLKSDDEGDQ